MSEYKDKKEKQKKNEHIVKHLNTYFTKQDVQIAKSTWKMINIINIQEKRMIKVK